MRLRAAAVALPIALLAACGGAKQPQGDTASAFAAMPGSVSEIDPATLAAKIEAGEAVLVDVRTPEEFAAGHIAGATNMPLEVFHADKLPHVAGKDTVLYCRTGKRSEVAARQVAAAGEDAVHLTGGIAAWDDAGEPVTR